MSKSSKAKNDDGCRLILIAHQNGLGANREAVLAAALSGGDVASVIFVQDGFAETGESADIAAFQSFCEPLVPMAQEAGAAAIICGDSRVAGRLKADGVHIEGPREDLDAAIEAADGRTIVGANGGGSKHDAIEAGDARPDYVFFGKLDGDTQAETHPANLERGAWWSSIIEIPCIIMGGSDVSSLEAIAATDTEFAALGRAVFDAEDPAAIVKKANEILAGI